MILGSSGYTSSFLIVDNNAAMRRTIGWIVRDLAGEVFECDDRAKVMAMCHQHRPHWVLMEIEMGANDGLATTRDLCRLYPDVRVVIVALDDHPSFRLAAKEAGACGYIVKEDLLALRELIISES
jgi:DNA-binding NarL/FixJ family response regulator